MFQNKKICIFGGSGSIGSLIVEYLITQNPDAIRIFTNDEHSLVKARRKWNYPFMRFILGDIRNPIRVLQALNGIDYVFNAAAIKHVPICEYNPLEAVEVNIIGLENIIQGCITRKVKKLLHISTDKAVNPTTLMGCTKRISEQLLQTRWYQNPEIQMVCVRLGNVWGSRGSLVPLIKKNMKKNKPITITDIQMSRFFITPEDTVKFIIKAFEKGKNGEIWVPKLRERSIMDVIQEITGKDYPIEIIGNRKHEKLHESLLSYGEALIADDTNPNYWILRAEGEKYEFI